MKEPRDMSELVMIQKNLKKEKLQREINLKRLIKALQGDNCAV